jgi:hypothetical protein
VAGKPHLLTLAEGGRGGVVVGIRSDNYKVTRLENGWYRAEVGGVVTEHRTYQQAFVTAQTKWRRSLLNPVSERHAFASWGQIAEIIGTTKQEAEQIGVRALVKIREGLLDDPMIPSLLEHLQIRTKEHE